jgi:LysR family glycine cleavage system transcriptional activator
MGRSRQKPDLRNLPLSTLRTFEAAARHQSFSKAATELNVTNSAVSHQLKRLEQAIETPLFYKTGRNIALTDAGGAFAKTVRDALDSIAATANSMQEEATFGGKLVIGCPPMFASKWLAKYFLDFTSLHRRIECHIKLVENSRLPFEQDYDVGIGFGARGVAGRWSHFLRKTTLTPALSSGLYAQTGKMLLEPSDLADVTLLHWDDGTEWRRWFTAVGLPMPASRQNHIYCNDMSIALDLAIEGIGAVLVSEVLSPPTIGQGSLVRPYEHNIKADGEWYAICDRYQIERKPVRAFLRWLLGRFGHILED